MIREYIPVKDCDCDEGMVDHVRYIELPPDPWWPKGMTITIYDLFLCLHCNKVTIMINEEIAQLRKYAESAIRHGSGHRAFAQINNTDFIKLLDEMDLRAETLRVRNKKIEDLREHLEVARERNMDDAIDLDDP